MKGFLFAFAACCTVLLQAQVSIHGRVSDLDQGDGIFGAEVHIDGRTALSGTDGTFIIEVARNDRYRILISALGFVPERIEKPRDGSDSLFVSVALRKALPEELETVVVTATRFEQKAEELTVSLDVLKPYLIENRNANDAGELLQMSPGIHLTDGQLNIRNGSGWTYGAGTRVQVLLDGLPLISPDAGQVQWNLMPMEAIGQVEVLKGSASALFGTSALNGVVHMRTLKPTEKPQTRVSVFNTVYGNPPRPELKWWSGTQLRSGLRMLHSVRKGKNEYVLNAYGQRDEGFKLLEVDNRARLNFSWMRKHTDKLQLGLSGGFLWSENGESLLWDAEERGYIALDSSVTITRGIDFYIDPKLIYRKGQHLHKLHLRLMRVENKARNLTTVFDNSSDQIQSQYTYQFFGNGWVLAGGFYSLFAASQSELFGGYHSAANIALFSQLDRKWSTGNISLGLRYENQWVDQLAYGRPVFRFGVNQALARNTFVRASFGQGFRFPSMAELFTATNVGNIYIYPNPELRPEQGYSAELAVRQVMRGKGWKTYADLAFYIMRFDNMMEFSFSNWGSIPENPLGVGFKSVNIGPTSISGVELEIGADWQGDDTHFRLLGGVNFSLPVALEPTAAYAEDSFGSEITYRSSSSDTTNDILKYRYTRLIRLDAEWGWKAWTLGVSVRNNDFMRNIDAIFESPLIELLVPGIGIENARKRLRRDDWLVDTRLLYRWNAQWTSGFLIENLLNYEVMSRPAELEAPRRFTLFVRFEP